MSVILCILGIVLMLYPEISAAALCYILGAVLVVYGVFKMIGYFSRDLYRLAFQFDLAFGILISAVGLIMILHPAKIIAFIYIAMGLIILTDGLFKIQIALDAKHFGMSRWWLIAALAVLTGVLGLFVVINPFESAAAIMAMLGAALLLEGILSLCVAIWAVKIISHQKPCLLYTSSCFREAEESLMVAMALREFRQEHLED